MAPTIEAASTAIAAWMTSDGLTLEKTAETGPASRRSAVTEAELWTDVRCVNATNSVSGGTVRRSQVPTRPDAPVTKTTRPATGGPYVKRLDHRDTT